MDKNRLIQNLSDRLSKYQKTDPKEAEHLIEDCLNEELNGYVPEERTKILDSLLEKFDKGQTEAGDSLSCSNPVLDRVFSLLLGRNFEANDISSDKQLNKLAESLNTIFDSLNHLISVINSTLCGSQEKDETIRQVIGYHMEDSGQKIPLKAYIGQITQAFLVTREASKDAACEKVNQILMELSPKLLEKEAGVMKLSPMKHAKCYKAYESKYNKFKQWFESGKFTEDYFREFEKQCLKTSFNDRR